MSFAKSVARVAGALLGGTIVVFVGAGLPGHLYLLAFLCGGAVAGALAPEISRWSGAVIGGACIVFVAAGLTAIGTAAHMPVPTEWATALDFWVASAATVALTWAGAVVTGWLRIRARERRASLRQADSASPTQC